MNYTYALITARKNSKAIKNKNLKKIGKYSLTKIAEKNYQKIKEIKKMFISSDSEKILNETSKKTFKILRPKRFSQDNSKSEEVVFHFLDWIKKKKIKFPKYLFIVQPTSPFVSSKSILKTLSFMKKKNCGSVTTIYKVPHKYNYINQRVIVKNKQLNFIFGKNKKKMFNRQLKPETFAHANIFLININKFIVQKNILSKPYYGVEIKNFKESIDIDNLADLKIARALNSKKI